MYYDHPSCMISSGSGTVFWFYSGLLQPISHHHHITLWSLARYSSTFGYSIGIAIEQLHLHIVHTDEIMRGILAEKHDAQKTVCTDGLEEAPSRGPDTWRKPRRRTPRGDAAHGGFVWVFNLDAAGVVHRGVELEVRSDRIVLPYAGV